MYRIYDVDIQLARVQHENATLEILITTDRILEFEEICSFELVPVASDLIALAFDELMFWILPHGTRIHNY